MLQTIILTIFRLVGSHDHFCITSLGIVCKWWYRQTNSWPITLHVVVLQPQRQMSTFLDLTFLKSYRLAIRMPMYAEAMLTYRFYQMESSGNLCLVMRTQWHYKGLSYIYIPRLLVLYRVGLGKADLPLLSNGIIWQSMFGNADPVAL